jgi:spore coat polysaccharide biosynthesis predicted glycosyltransferase SpsG
LKNNNNILLIGSCGSKYGMGHISRLKSILDEIKRIRPNNKIFFALHGDKCENLRYWDVDLIPIQENFDLLLKTPVIDKDYDAIIIDVFPGKFFEHEAKFEKLMMQKESFNVLIGILTKNHHYLSLMWYPSFVLPSEFGYAIEKIHHGWDAYFINNFNRSLQWQFKKEVLVLTGASDFARLGNYLPNVLDCYLEEGSKIIWVQGPFASDPIIPKTPRLNWDVIKDPEDIYELMKKSSVAFSVYGVTFFELIALKIPTVTFSIFPERDLNEIKALKNKSFANVADSQLEIVEKINFLLERSEAERINAELEKFNFGNGAFVLASLIYQ